ncbi:cyclin-D3-3-like [Rutidosis leptorrhynchoides]|uniref:cyclin-D3-3-like n=1 Tax=Rutidosis leptorrhynchoides TaxID=125765 RepID=UPI003A9925F3
MVAKRQKILSIQNPNFAIGDSLLCDEQHCDFDFGSSLLNKQEDEQDPNFIHFQQHDLLWEVDELLCLLNKQKENAHFVCYNDDVSLMVSRKESVDWMIRVSSHYGFVALTTVLAINYFDRFLVTTTFQRDNKPWMNQLVAVACLSLASKVEEIQTPLLIDLQIEGAKFVFESKTIMKIELLVLSSLEWKMNPVTPISFFDYIMRRLNLMTHNLHYEFLRRCERILVSVIIDSRFQHFLPSVMAAAIMCIVSTEIEPDNALDYRNQLIHLLNICEDNLDECSNFIKDLSNIQNSCYFPNHKRKYFSVPESPNGVADTYFSSDNSSNSWVITSSVTSSPEAPLKKNRAQEQQMRLTPVNRVSNIY